jgi:hypothetical protein
MTPVPEPGAGISFMHIVGLYALLTLTVIMLVMAKKSAEARFNVLNKQLNEVHAQLLNIKK